MLLEDFKRTKKEFKRVYELINNQFDEIEEETSLGNHSTSHFFIATKEKQMTSLK